MGQLWSSRWGSSCIKTLSDNDCCFDSIKNNKSLLPWKGKHPRWHSWIYECGWKWWSMVFELRNFTCNFFLTLEQSAAFQIISCKRFIRVTITLSFHNKKKLRSGILFCAIKQAVASDLNDKKLQLLCLKGWFVKTVLNSSHTGTETFVVKYLRVKTLLYWIYGF